MQQGESLRFGCGKRSDEWPSQLSSPDCIGSKGERHPEWAKCCQIYGYPFRIDVAEFDAGECNTRKGNC